MKISELVQDIEGYWNHKGKPWEGRVIKEEDLKKCVISIVKKCNAWLIDPMRPCANEDDFDFKCKACKRFINCFELTKKDLKA